MSRDALHVVDDLALTVAPAALTESIVGHVVAEMFGPRRCPRPASSRTT